MRKTKNIIGLVLYLLYALLIAYYDSQPSALRQLILILAMPIILTAFIYSILLIPKLFKEPFYQVRIEALSTFTGFVIFVLIASNIISVSQYEFVSEKAAMEQFINQVPVTQTWLSSSNGDIKIPTQISSYINAIKIRKDAKNETTAYFLFGSGFPAHHYYWYYDSSDKPPPPEGGYRKLDKCWYYVSA